MPNQGMKMLDEYEPRCKQVSKMAGQVWAVKIDQRVMLMILKISYYPAIRLCLPITTFTDKQCNTIQRLMTNAALPKLGINRNSHKELYLAHYDMVALIYFLYQLNNNDNISSAI